MKITALKALSIFGLSTIALNTNAQEAIHMNHTASYIEMNAATGQTTEFAQFLTGAAPIVRQTEPGTTLWFALQGAEKQLAIFDIFTSEQARNTHFSGVVAGALHENAERLVQGGWNDGVVANINNSAVLSAKAPVEPHSATTASYIKLRAAPGQSEALAQLLTAAGPIVAETEPQTLYWVALQIDENNFAIFDIFASNQGREAHFAGKVANLLKHKSAQLVEGGWEQGVVANVSNYSILAIN